MSCYRFFIICKLICLLYPSVVLADSKPERQLNKLTLEETRSAIREYNKTAPEGEEIVSERSYSIFHHKIGTPVFRTLRRYHEKQFGTGAGLAEYLFPARNRPARRQSRQSRQLTLEETRSAIQEYNKTAPEGEEVVSERSYSSFRDRVPRAPSIPLLYHYHKEQFGTGAGLVGYLFPARSRPARRQSRQLTLEETRSAIREYNKTAPAGEEIKDLESTYNWFRDRIPRAPSIPLLYHYHKEQFGTGAGLVGYLFPARSRPARRQSRQLTLEETRSAIQEYNKTAPEGEEIVSERSYSSFHHKIGTPVFRTLRRYHEKQFGTGAGLAEYLFPARSRRQLTLEETRSAIQEYNKTAPEGEEIISKHSYSSFRDRIPRAPSIPLLYHYHKEQFGTGAGLVGYLFPARSRRQLTLEETRSAIREYNKTAPAGEEIKDLESTYNWFRDRIPRAPSIPLLYRYHKEQFGTGAGLVGYLFPARSRRQLTLEETRSAIREYNKTAPEGEEVVSERSYSSFRDRIPRAPSIPLLYHYHKEQFGTGAGLVGYLFPARSRRQLTLEETRSAIQEYNKTAPEGEEIVSERSYSSFHHKIGTPVFRTLRRYHEKQFGTGAGLAKYLFPVQSSCENELTAQ